MDKTLDIEADTAIRVLPEKDQAYMCDSPNLLQISVDAIVLFSHFGRATGLLARPIH
jgi:hypothetical protein